jgi:hypothetical protein
MSYEMPSKVVSRIYKPLICDPGRSGTSPCRPLSFSSVEPRLSVCDGRVSSFQEQRKDHVSCHGLDPIPCDCRWRIRHLVLILREKKGKTMTMMNGDAQQRAVFGVSEKLGEEELASVSGGSRPTTPHNPIEQNQNLNAHVRNLRLKVAGGVVGGLLLSGGVGVGIYEGIKHS